MDRLLLQPGDVSAGTPLPWRVYDAAGRMLFADGHCFDSDAEVEVFLAREVYRDAGTDMPYARRPAEDSDPFAQLAEALPALANGLSAVAAGTCPDATAWLFPLLDRLADLNRLHADAVMGALLLTDAAPYAQVHPWMTATLCELLSRRAGWPARERRTLLAAAFTANVGMFDIQDTLAEQQAPLDDAQRLRVRQHPVRSAQLLAAAGVQDAPWLKAVLVHHERLDGSGYPRQLAGEDIPRVASLIALADIYSAMLLPRRYRDGLHAKKALREIFTQRGSQIDAALAAMFIKEIGVYPPGIFVRLANGETAVVVRRNPRHANKPIVSSLHSPLGRALERPIIRDTSETRSFEVQEVLPRQPVPFPLPVVWGYSY